MTLLGTPRLRLVGPCAAHLAARGTFDSLTRAATFGWTSVPYNAGRRFVAVTGHHVQCGFDLLVGKPKDDEQMAAMFGPRWSDDQPEHKTLWTVWSEPDQSKGLAYDAARATLAYAFGRLGWDAAVSYIAHGNHLSATLARRLEAMQYGAWVKPRVAEVRALQHYRVVA